MTRPMNITEKILADHAGLEEVKAGYMILKSLGLRQRGINFVSCPTCGRTQIDLIGLAKTVEKRLENFFFENQFRQNEREYDLHADPDGRGQRDRHQQIDSQAHHIGGAVGQAGHRSINAAIAQNIRQIPAIPDNAHRQQHQGREAQGDDHEFVGAGIVKFERDIFSNSNLLEALLHNHLLQQCNGS